MSVSSTQVIQAVNQTNLTAATRYYPSSDGMQLQSASELVLAMVCSGGVTVTVEHAAMTPDETAPAAGDWQDVTAKAVAIVGTAGASYVDTTAEIALVLPRGRVRVKYVTSDGSNSVRLSFSVRHLVDSAVTHAGLLAGISDSQPRNVAVYHTTTTAKTDGVRAALELSKQGGEFVDASARHFRALALPTTAGAITAFTAPLAEGHCNGISVDDDDSFVFAQPIERDWLVKEHNFATVLLWTLGAGWSPGTNKITHTAGGGTATAVQTTATANPNDPILVGGTYAVVAKISGRTAGGVSVGIGTTAGTSRTADNWYIELLTAAGSGNPTITPTNEFDGSVEFVYIIPMTGKLKAGVVYPIAAHSVAAVSASAAPATMTSRRVVAYWHRRINATELV